MAEVHAIPPISVRNQVSPEEWEQRVNLAAAYRLIAHYGWDDMVFTHLSARVPGPEHHFLINPYGMLFDEVTASSLVKIDLDGKVVLDNGYPVNAAGFTIHSAVHEAREDAISVMHVHTVDGTAVSAMAEGLMPLNQTALLVRADMATHEYEGVAFDLAERPRLVKDLGNKHLMLLRNHGTLSLGSTIAEAFVRLYFFERACSMQVRSLTGGTANLHYPKDSVMAKVAEQGSNDKGLTMAANALCWPALLRLLDRQGADYNI